MRLSVLLIIYAAALIGVRTIARVTRANRRVTASVVAAVTGLFFACANVLNLGAPGWCEIYGFPIPYKRWSDAQVIFNGLNLGIQPFTPLFAVADGLIAITAVVFAFRIGSRRWAAA